MSGEAIITLIAIAIILVVFGIPLYVVRRRNRVQAEEANQENPVTSETTEVTEPIFEPHLTQEPEITTAPIAANPYPALSKLPNQEASVPVETKASSGRNKETPLEKQLETLVKSIDKIQPLHKKPKPKKPKTNKPKTPSTEKKLVKELNKAIDKVQPALTKEFAKRVGLQLDEAKKGKPKTSKKPATKSAKKGVTKPKKTK